MSNRRAGLAPFRTFQTWYTVFGDLHGGNGKLPVVVLHGGPGAGCRSEEVALESLWTTAGIPVVVYDQVGCGRSTPLDDQPAELFSVQFYLEELANLLQHLEIKEYDLLGHSWGGMLGLEHAALQPAGLRKIVLECAPASMELCMQVRDDVYRSLGERYYNAVVQHDRDGIVTDDVNTARELINSQWRCRTVPFPAAVKEVADTLRKPYHVCNTMWGLTKILQCTGCLKDWTIVPRLPQIHNEVLVITGTYDYCGKQALAPYLEGNLNAKLVTFENCGHFVHIDGGQAYISCVVDFLQG